MAIWRPSGDHAHWIGLARWVATCGARVRIRNGGVASRTTMSPVAERVARRLPRPSKQTTLKLRAASPISVGIPSRLSSIAMGAPSGVAVGQPNAEELYLKPGDDMTIAFEGLMSLRTRIVAEI